MPKKLVKKRELTGPQFIELWIGWAKPLPWQAQSFSTLAEVRRAWQENRKNPSLCSWMYPDRRSFAPGERPWAWWEFESPEPRNPEETEAEQLHRLGLLTDHEKEALGISR